MLIRYAVLPRASASMKASRWSLKVENRHLSMPNRLMKNLRTLNVHYYPKEMEPELAPVSDMGMKM